MSRKVKDHHFVETRIEKNVNSLLRKVKTLFYTQILKEHSRCFQFGLRVLKCIEEQVVKRL